MDSIRNSTSYITGFNPFGSIERSIFILSTASGFRNLSLLRCNSSYCLIPSINRLSTELCIFGGISIVFGSNSNLPSFHCRSLNKAFSFSISPIDALNMSPSFIYINPFLSSNIIFNTPSFLFICRTWRISASDIWESLPSIPLPPPKRISFPAMHCLTLANSSSLLIGFIKRLSTSFLKPLILATSSTIKIKGIFFVRGLFLAELKILSPSSAFADAYRDFGLTSVIITARFSLNTASAASDSSPKSSGSNPFSLRH